MRSVMLVSADIFRIIHCLNRQKLGTSFYPGVKGVRGQPLIAILCHQIQS